MIVHCLIGFLQCMHNWPSGSQVCRFLQVSFRQGLFVHKSELYSWKSIWDFCVIHLTNITKEMKWQGGGRGVVGGGWGELDTTSEWKFCVHITRIFWWTSHRGTGVIYKVVLLHEDFHLTPSFLVQPPTSMQVFQIQYYGNCCIL